jgi:hypothetical protein
MRHVEVRTRIDAINLERYWGYCFNCDFETEEFVFPEVAEREILEHVLNEAASDLHQKAELRLV